MSEKFKTEMPVWIGGIYLKEEGGYEIILKSLTHYKKRLRNIRKSPEIKDAPMFATIIESEAQKSYQAANNAISKITESLAFPEKLSTIESEIPLIEKALVCYHTDISKKDTDPFYSELITDMQMASQDAPKILLALKEIKRYY
ncbi:MAG: hypothetical protein ACKO7Y_07110 [Candidatus Nitrosotenuis sp.]